MAGLQHISESLYHGLCMKLGTRQQLCMRRDVMDIGEIMHNSGRPYSVYNTMISGSMREGFRLSDSDYDNMFWSINDKVVYNLPQSDNYHHLPNTRLILMECENSPPGFVLLQVVIPTNGLIVREAVWKSCVIMNDRLYISSTLYREQMCSFIHPNSTVHGPCASGHYGIFEYDDAHCFKCDFWPQSALPMIKRCQTWPPLLVLHDIYNSGCHIVAKGSTLSPNEDNEWRISFSQAEQKLVYALNHSQFLVYGLLKLFLKEVINKGVDDKLLCSYFMKTVIFWEIGENKIPCWCPQNIVTCFWSCFKHIIQWVYHGQCPNFFIPQNNMFSGRIVGNKQHNLFQQLYGLYKQGYTCLLLSPSVRSYILQVLCNPTIGVNVNEETFISVADFDAKLYCEINLYIISINCSLFSNCLNFLHRVEHLLQTPLTHFHCISLQKCTSTILQHIAFHLHNRCGDRLSTKMMYITDRASCHMLKLAAKFGCISDLLYIAMYYYRTCRYTEALCIIEMTKVNLSQPYVIYRSSVNKDRYTEAVGGQSWSIKMREAVAFDIKLQYDVCYIKELILEQLLSVMNSRFVLFIPPWVMLHMLSILCYNHVDIVRRQQALDDLYVLLYHDAGVHVPVLVRDISYQILGLCQEVCGDRLNALHSYQESLGQYPQHKIQRATQIRIQHVLDQLST